MSYQAHRCFLFNVISKFQLRHVKYLVYVKNLAKNRSYPGPQVAYRLQ